MKVKLDHPLDMQAHQRDRRFVDQGIATETLSAKLKLPDGKVINDALVCVSRRAHGLDFFVSESLADFTMRDSPDHQPYLIGNYPSWNEIEDILQKLDQKWLEFTPA